MIEDIKPGEALVLSPAQTCAALGCGTTKLWALIKAGELDAFLDGNRRRITKASVRDYVNRKLASAQTKKPTPARRASAA